jgi:flagellar biosynthesis protein FlhG
MLGLRYDSPLVMPWHFAEGDKPYLFREDRAMQVIAVTGGKGGVGKTNIAVNLAVAMASDGLDVLLLDADLGLANVDVVLGMSVQHTLADVVDGTRTLKDIVAMGPEGLRVVPASSGVAKLTTLSAEIQTHLIEQFSTELTPPDVLIVDTGAGIDTTVQTFVAACQTVVVVVCDEPASLTDAYALIKVMRKEKGVRRFEILANQVDSASQGRHVYDRLSKVTDRYLDVELGFLGSVPTDSYLKRAVQERTALVTRYPRAPAAGALRDMARRLSRDAQRAPSAGMGFFIEQVLQAQRAVHH